MRASSSSASTTTNVHLIKYSLPVKQCKTATDVICLHLMKNNDQTLFSDARHVNGEHVCNLKLAHGDRAMVMAVDLVYYTNDSDSRLEMVLDLKFLPLLSPPPPPASGAGAKRGEEKVTASSSSLPSPPPASLMEARPSRLRRRGGELTQTTRVS